MTKNFKSQVEKPGFFLRLSVLMKSSKLQLLALVCFLIILTIAAFIGQARLNTQRIVFACDKVSTHYYLDNQKLRNWYNFCILESNKFVFSESKEHVFVRIKMLLSILEGSHLDVYSPVEDKKVWKGQSKDTGIRVRYLDNMYIVSHLIKNSLAEQSGIQLGDVILSINGHSINNTYTPQTKEGKYIIRRSKENNKKYFLNIQANEIKVDGAPMIKTIGGGAAILKVSSFRPEYFEMKLWAPIQNKLSNYKKIILDLRGNIGGSFVAGLRLISPFVCQPTNVGYLQRPRNVGMLELELENKLITAKAWQQFDDVHKVYLKTYPVEKCFKGELRVLIDASTSSVSEVVADALQFRRNTILLGGVTKGDVLLGEWYKYPLLGKGYTISIPEATYINAKGLIIEGVGVMPEYNLFYELEDTLKGKDSWVEQSIKY